MQFNAVVETNTAAVRLWRSLGLRGGCNDPGRFLHPLLATSGATSCTGGL